jgi:hypothetical protein
MLIKLKIDVKDNSAYITTSKSAFSFIFYLKTHITKNMCINIFFRINEKFT